MADQTIIWETGAAFVQGVGTVVSADMKGWRVEIVRQDDGQFDINVDGRRCNCSRMPTLEDAYELGKFVYSKLREKIA